MASLKKFTISDKIAKLFDLRCKKNTNTHRLNPKQDIIAELTVNQV